MSNVVDFPVADRPITEDEIDKLHSKAFSDLEGEVCDLERRARLPKIISCNAAPERMAIVRWNCPPLPSCSWRRC